uniref:G protein-coupled receptor n=1 Tax=Panagrellus redivivus TaxID=6233 RepID=A0A7E4UQD1_PANRE
MKQFGGALHYYNAEYLFERLISFFTIVTLPTLCIVGFIQNIPCLVITAKRRGQPHMPAIFVLSFFDTLQLTFSMALWFFKTFQIYKLDSTRILAKLYGSDSFHALIAFALNYASVLTLLFITVQRYCAIVIVRPSSAITTFKMLVTQFLPIISIVMITILHFADLPLLAVYGAVLILTLIMNPNWSSTEPSFILRLAEERSVVPVTEPSEVQFQHTLYHDIVVEYRS